MPWFKTAQIMPIKQTIITQGDFIYKALNAIRDSWKQIKQWQWQAVDVVMPFWAPVTERDDREVLNSYSKGYR